VLFTVGDSSFRTFHYRFLYTAQRWHHIQETRVSVTNCAMHLCKCNGIADLLKHAPPHRCYHAEFGRSALKSVGINTGDPKNWTALSCLVHCLEMGSVADAKIHAPPPHYVTLRKVGVLRQRLKLYIENPKIGERLGSTPFGFWRGWPLKRSPSPYVLPRQML